MTRRSGMRCRRLAGLVAVVFAAASGGCTSGDGAPEPAPRPAYQQPATDLCERVRLDDVLRQHGLTVFPGHEPRRYYDSSRSRWYVMCGFAGLAEDGRFATEIGEFRPAGAVTLAVYHDPADAVDAYDQTARGRFARQAELVPGAAVAEVTGWWDSGASLDLAAELDPDDYVIGDFQATRVGVEWLVRHENLLANGYVSGLAPTGETAEAFALLRDLVAAMLDEAVAPLTLDTGQ